MFFELKLSYWWFAGDVRAADGRQEEENDLNQMIKLRLQ